MRDLREESPSRGPPTRRPCPILTPTSLYSHQLNDPLSGAGEVLPPPGPFFSPLRARIAIGDGVPSGEAMTCITLVLLALAPAQAIAPEPFADPPRPPTVRMVSHD